jgi:archaemetzincin
LAAATDGKFGTHVEEATDAAAMSTRDTTQPGKGNVRDRPIIAVALLGDALDEELLQELRRVLASAFDAEIVTVPGIPLPPSAYDRGRRQYHTTPILRQLASEKPPDAARLIGVADVDLYVPELNFVFGEADGRHGVAVFSLARLRQYGSDPRALFLKRAATEAIHELGHTYGLNHCASPRCVMWFSNTLGETDSKGLAFCTHHAAQLDKVRRRSEAHPCSKSETGRHDITTRSTSARSLTASN